MVILLSKKAEKELLLIMQWGKGVVFIYKLVKPRPRTKYTIKFLKLFRPLCSPDLLKPGLTAVAETHSCSLVLHFLDCIWGPQNTWKENGILVSRC